MQNETLMFGDVCLEDYLKPTKKISTEEFEAEEQEARQNIERIRKIFNDGSSLSKVLSFEKSILHESEYKSKKILKPINFAKVENQYPELDLSFLSMSNLSPPFDVIRYNVKKRFSLGKKYKKGKAAVGLPKFAIYPFFGSNTFAITLGNRGGFYDDEWRSYIGLSFDFRSGFDVESFLEKHYNTQFYLVEEGQKPQQIDKRKICLPSNEELKFNARFNGMIPQEIKQKAAEADEQFNEGIYLIAGVKEDEWDKQTYARDPLLIGLQSPEGNERGKVKAHLIGKFNTIPLEEYVQREFTTRNSK